jgi:predicted dehydrogenase
VAGRHCIEGLMYRHHPQTTLARKLVADGAIGRLAAAIAGGGEPSFDRSDAIAQATVIEALYRSAELGTPVAVGSAG